MVQNATIDPSRPAAAGMDTAPSENQKTAGGKAGGGLKKPRLITLGKPFSGGAFVSYVWVNGQTVPEFTSAHLKSGDQVSIIGGGLIGFSDWVIFQKGKAGRAIAAFTGRDDKNITFIVPKDWEGYFLSDAGAMLTFANKERTAFWGLPVNFFFGKEPEAENAEQSAVSGQKVNANAAPGGQTSKAAMGPTGLMMGAMEEAMTGVISPFLPNANRNKKRNELDAALKSGDKSKISQAVKNMKAAKDAEGLRLAAKNAPKEHIGLLNDAISEVNQLNISAAQTASSLESMSADIDMDDVEGGTGEVSVESEVSAEVQEQQATAQAAQQVVEHISQNNLIADESVSAEVTEALTTQNFANLSVGGRQALTSVATQISGQSGPGAAELQMSMQMAAGGQGVLSAEVEERLNASIDQTVGITETGSPGGGQATVTVASGGSSGAGTATASLSAQPAQSGAGGVSGAGAVSMGSPQNREMVGEYLSKKPEVITGPKVNGQIRTEVLGALASGNSANLSPAGRQSLRATIKVLSQQGGGHPADVMAAAGQLNVSAESGSATAAGSSVDGIAPAESEQGGGGAFGSQPGAEGKNEPASELPVGENDEQPNQEEQETQPDGQKSPEENPQDAETPEEEKSEPAKEEPKTPAEKEDGEPNGEKKPKEENPESPAGEEKKPDDNTNAGNEPKEETPPAEPLPPQPEASEPGEPKGDIGEPINHIPGALDEPGAGGGAGGAGDGGNLPEEKPEPGAPGKGAPKGEVGAPLGNIPGSQGEGESGGGAPGAQGGQEAGAPAKAGEGAGAGAGEKGGALGEGMGPNAASSIGGKPNLAGAAGAAASGDKAALIKQAVALVNPAMNDLLDEAAIWVWATSIPSFGLSILLGAIVGDFLWAFKKWLIKKVLEKVWIAKTIVGKEISEDEIADQIQFSWGVKANIIAMNLIVAIVLAAIIFLFVAIFYAGCTISVAGFQTFNKATSYKTSIFGVLGLSQYCQQITDTANVVTGGIVSSPVNPLPYSSSAGACNVASSGIITPGQLASTCFGSDPNIDSTASIIAMHESGGNPAIASGVDYCRDQNGQPVLYTGKYSSLAPQVSGQPVLSVSWGLFQINLTANKIYLTDGTVLDCPSSVGPMYTAQQHHCSITDPVLFDKCVGAAANAQNNIQTACQLSKKGTSWGPWQADIVACKIGQ